MGIRSILLICVFQIMSVDGQVSGNTSVLGPNVRLVGGQRQNEGRVEVYYNGAWGTICDDLWDDNAAAVVCKMRGYSTIGATALCCATFGDNTYLNIFLDDVSCGGYESSIYNCNHSQWFNHDCSHQEDAGVRCGTPIASDIQSCQVENIVPADFLLFTGVGTIYRIDINDYSYIDISMQISDNAYDIDYDPTHAVIFWTDGFSIYSVSIHGTSVKIVRSFDSKIYDIAVDSVSRILFYTDEENGIIAVINLENFSHKTVIRNTLKPRNIVTDPINGIIYWIDWPAKIMKSNYDGTNLLHLRSLSLRTLYGKLDVDADIDAGKLYSCHGANTTIWRFDVNDSDLQLIYHTQEQAYGCSIAMYQSYVYFTFGSGVKRIGTDGTGLISVNASEHISPGAIHVHTNRSRGTNECSNGNGGCSHFCFPVPGAHKMCACPDLMTIQPDKTTCRDASFLLLTTNSTPAATYSIINHDYIKIPLQPHNTPHAITYNPIDQVIFWTDTRLKQISSASIDGHNEWTISKLNDNTSPQGIAIDALSRLLFYTDKKNGIIAVLNLNGSIQKVVINSTSDKPYDIVTDPINGTIYWTSLRRSKIETSNYDGTNRHDLIKTDFGSPTGLAIDITEGVLYWCIGGISGMIFKAKVNDWNQQLIYEMDADPFVRIAFDQSYLYFTTQKKSCLKRIGKDGRNLTELQCFNAELVDIHLPVNGPNFTGTNGCSNGNSGCSDFCFPRPGGFKVCACPDGLILQPDGKTCDKCLAPLEPESTMTTLSEFTVELTVLRAVVGSLAGLLVVSVLLSVWFIRKNRSPVSVRMQMENTKKLPDAYSMATEDDNGQYHTISATISTELSGEHEGSMAPNISGGNGANDYIHSIHIE